VNSHWNRSRLTATAGQVLLRALAALVLALPTGLRAAVVLQYHHVSDTTPAATSTSPARFAAHLDHLERSGIAVVPLQDLVDALKAGRPLPDRAAAITFDDGYVSIYETAWPLLRAKNFPFTVFVNTEPHDAQRPLFMSWAQLRELHAAGATIANHGVSHARLLERRPGRDGADWRDWVTNEIRTAQRRITEEIGAAPMLFAWPFGEFDAELLEILGELGFAGFGQQSGPLAPHDDLRALPRFPFGGSYGDPADFAVKVDSLPMPLAEGAGARRLQADDGRPLADIVLDGPARPVLLLELAEGIDPARMACFVSGQGEASIAIEGQRIRVQASQPLSRGSARYNCTLPGREAGRYHWYSQPWFIRQEIDR